MRKLKLQVQMSVDGYMEGLKGEGLGGDLHSIQDEELVSYIHSTIDTSDTILLGRKTSEAFIPYWENVANTQPESPAFSFAQKMVDTPKVVFSKTLKKSTWNNTTLATGDLVDEVNKLKNKAGKDIIVYGGAEFVSALTKEGLVDEFHLFINPTALGQGIAIFNGIAKQQYLKLKAATAFSSEVVVLFYELKRD